MSTIVNGPPASEIYQVVKRYADAWSANDLPTIIASYHDDVVFHYFGRNALAGTHRGKANGGFDTPSRSGSWHSAGCTTRISVLSMNV